MLTIRMFNLLIHLNSSLSDVPMEADFIMEESVFFNPYEFLLASPNSASAGNNIHIPIKEQESPERLEHSAGSHSINWHTGRAHQRTIKG